MSILIIIQNVPGDLVTPLKTSKTTPKDLRNNLMTR